MRKSFVFLAMLPLSFVSPGCGASGPRNYGYQIVNTFPHDPTAFTEGLEFRDGYLYESTGLNGKSSLRKVKLETGEVVQRFDIMPDYFGEGITVLPDKIIQLTYQTQTGFVYDRKDFKLERTFNYKGEGWGLTSGGNVIYMSDGTSAIRVWDAATLAEKMRITVHDGETQISGVNELELVDGEIYANIWKTERIARISPVDGKVLGWINLAGILENRPPEADVMNGIAYDSVGKRLFVTGKYWPKLFEIKLIEK